MSKFHNARNENFPSHFVIFTFHLYSVPHVIFWRRHWKRHYNRRSCINLRIYIIRLVWQTHNSLLQLSSLAYWFVKPPDVCRKDLKLVVCRTELVRVGIEKNPQKAEYLLDVVVCSKSSIQQRHSAVESSSSVSATTDPVLGQCHHSRWRHSRVEWRHTWTVMTSVERHWQRTDTASVSPSSLCFPTEKKYFSCDDIGFRSVVVD